MRALQRTSERSPLPPLGVIQSAGGTPPTARAFSVVSGRCASAHVRSRGGTSANRDSDIELHRLFLKLSFHKLYSRGDDPVLDGLKLSLEKRIDERRKAIWEAGRTIGVTATVSQERWRQIAQLAPTDAARWVGRDLRFVKFFESELWDAVEVPLRWFVPVAKRRRRKVIARAAPGEEDRAVAAAFSPEELAALDSIASEVAETITRAKSRAEAQDGQVAEVLDTVSRVRGARDPRERSMLKTGLVDELAKDARAHGAISGGVDAAGTREWSGPDGCGRCAPHRDGGDSYNLWQLSG